MSPGTATFLRGGVHVDHDGKASTAHLPIERFIPAEVTIPLAQHLGPPARAVVQRKAVVARGDLIGESEATGAPVHASVSGVVQRVALAPHPTLVESPAVVIKTAPEAIETLSKEDAREDLALPVRASQGWGGVKWQTRSSGARQTFHARQWGWNRACWGQEPPMREVPNWRDLPPDTMIAQIAAAGIVGLGGATFPTHRKLRLPPGVTIDTLLLNGAECEPYLTSDHRLMLEHPDEVVSGATVLGTILGASEILIGVEDNKPDVLAALRGAIARARDLPVLRLVTCATRYPQGSERQLVEACVGRVVPAGRLPMHVGVMVQNVATAVACYRAVRYQQPLLDRVITVSGGGINTPKNLAVPIGTLVNDIVAVCGGMHRLTAKVIAGGPMMGRALGRLDVPVIKGTAGLIFLRADEIRQTPYGPCIACGRCLEVCPLGLEPNQIAIYTEAGRALETETYGTRECFECGCCAYVCPAARPLVQFIQIAKSAFQTGSALGLAVRPDQRLRRPGSAPLAPQVSGSPTPTRYRELRERPGGTHG